MFGAAKDEIATVFLADCNLAFAAQLFAADLSPTGEARLAVKAPVHYSDTDSR